MNYEESDAWRPTFKGWSRDILPFYDRMASQLADGAKIVEIGTAWGRSAAFLASRLVALGKARCTVWGIDPHPVAWAPGWYAEALGMLVKHTRPEELAILHMVRATSVQAARMFDEGSLDLVFVDGLHDEKSVQEDIITWLPKINLSSGMIAGHDYDRFQLAEGVSEHPGVKRAVDRFFPRVEVEGSVWQWRAK